MTVYITPETHGKARCDAIARLHHRLVAALTPFRGKDPGIDFFFARLAELDGRDDKAQPRERTQAAD